MTPLIGSVRGDEFGEVHAGNSGKFAGMRHHNLRVWIARDDAPRLRALLPNDARELAGIDIGDGDHITLT